MILRYVTFALSALTAVAGAQTRPTPTNWWVGFSGGGGYEASNPNKAPLSVDGAITFGADISRR